MELDEDCISTNNGDNMLEFGVAFKFDRNDIEVEAELEGHMALEVGKFEGVPKHKSDLSMHEVGCKQRHE